VDQAVQDPVQEPFELGSQLRGNPAGPANGAWPLEHPVTASLAWTALLLIVFVPLCTARYARPE
jgi:ABC-2 type transport system permease protein